MTETNQEDLSVEDILSSIKNILVDDAGAAESKSDNTIQLPVALPQTESEEKNEDIFDLDASMIIEDSPNAIERLLPMTPPAEETTAPQESLVDSIDINKALDMADKIDLSSISGLNDILTEDAPVSQPTAEVAEETIDASANIINNFAKLFAEKQQAQTAVQPRPNETIAAQISTDIENQNISEMVKSAIISQVKTSLNADFERIASDIIAEQTKIWLNQNLAAIVEKTVAAEIARVIAKVGS